MYTRIIDHPNLVRDMDTKAVLNIDVEGKARFLKAREDKRKDKQRLNDLEANVASMAVKLNLILDLLRNKT
jgi:hypothetical protein